MRIKVCCIQSIDEARLAISSGAHALGLVSKMPTGTRGIGDNEIRTIIEAIPPTFSTVLLTPSADPMAIVRHKRATGANTLQLVGPIGSESVRELREALPGIALIKVVHVEDSTSVDAALSFSSVADVLLLDTKARVRGGEALGGTGVTHDWSISRRIVEVSPLPVFLAGGLSPENVAEAIRTVSPFGVDVCSSLRPSQTLEPDRLGDFVARALGATT
jgi:phosphoribosylanthranilate isomerase